MPGSSRTSRARVTGLVFVLLAAATATRAQREVEPEVKPLPSPTGWQLRVGLFKMQASSNGDTPLNGPVIDVSSSNGREYNVVERGACLLMLPFQVMGECKKGDVLTLARLTLAGRKGGGERRFPLIYGKRVLAESWDGDTLETPYFEPGGRAGDPVSWCNQSLEQRAGSQAERVAALKRGFTSRSKGPTS